MGKAAERETVELSDYQRELPISERDPLSLASDQHPRSRSKSNYKYVAAKKMRFSIKLPLSAKVNRTHRSIDCKKVPDNRTN